jgi:hypothetical protein
VTGGLAGAYGPPGGCGGLVTIAGGVDRAEEFAEPEGRAVPRAPADGLAGAEVAVLEAAELEFCALWVVEVWVVEAWAAEVWALDRCVADGRPEAAVAEGWWLGRSGPEAGLNVATDSMAPATRQTARMLASSGITVPGPENGAVSRRSRRRRRRARSSRW